MAATSYAGGVYCQVFHYGTMSYDRIRLLVRTFTHTFKEAALFATRGGEPTGDLLLVGSDGPLRLAHIPEDRTLPEAVRAAFAEINNSGTQQLLSGLIAGPRDIASFAGAGPLHTENQPALEIESSGDRFGAFFDENLGKLLSAMARTSLPAGPPPVAAPAAREIARDGFTLPHGLPEGEETLRGMTVLTRVRPGGANVSRWVLVGREFKGNGAGTSLYRLARPAQGPAEVLDIATSLAGLTATRAQGSILVNGHSAAWTASETISERTVALGWICSERGEAFFLTRRVPIANAPSGPDITADLALRFPCSHGR